MGPSKKITFYSGACTIKFSTTEASILFNITHFIEGLKFVNYINWSGITWAGSDLHGIFNIQVL
jgi:hypothetical protein